MQKLIGVKQRQKYARFYVDISFALLIMLHIQIIIIFKCHVKALD